MATTSARRTRKCRRCNGTGQASGGVCFRCNGSTIDPGPAARPVALTEAAKADQAAVVALSAAIDALPRGDRNAARDGLAHLKARAADRHAKALASVQAGRTAAVVAHLVTYGREI